jgi:hypothetical protein
MGHYTYHAVHFGARLCLRTAAIRWYMTIESQGTMILTGQNRKTRRKTCLTLSTTNLTYTDRDANPGLSGEKSATNHLSHGTATCNYHRAKKSYKLSEISELILNWISPEDQVLGSWERRRYFLMFHVLVSSELRNCNRLRGRGDRLSAWSIHNNRQ